MFLPLYIHGLYSLLFTSHLFYTTSSTPCVRLNEFSSAFSFTSVPHRLASAPAHPLTSTTLQLLHKSLYHTNIFRRPDVEIHTYTTPSRCLPQATSIRLLFRLCLHLSLLAAMGCEIFTAPLKIQSDLHHIQYLKSPHTSDSAPDYRRYGLTYGPYSYSSSSSEFSSRFPAYITTSTRPR